MAMSYTTLTAAKSEPGSIRSWMNYAKIDVEGVLEDAQLLIYGRLRIKDMKVSDTAPVKAGAFVIDCPDDFLDPIEVWDITNGFELNQKSNIERFRSYSNAVLTTATPAYYEFINQQLELDCKAAAAFVAKLVYYGMPPLLSESVDTNFLTRKHGHLLRMACLATAARHNHDSEIFDQEAQLLFNAISELAANEEMSGSTDAPTWGLE